METFTDSSGYQYIMGWGFCACYVWYISHQYNKEYAGRCERCGEGVYQVPLGWDKEQTIARFEHEYGRAPKPFR